MASEARTWRTIVLCVILPGVSCITPAWPDTTALKSPLNTQSLPGVRQKAPMTRMSLGAQTADEGAVGNPRILLITIRSSRQQVLVAVDGEVVINVDDRAMNTTDELETAGLYFVLLSQYDGSVIMNRVFNLHKYAHSLDIPPLFTSLSSGRIMVLAVKTDAGLNMPKVVRKLLQELGSLKSHMLNFRGYLAWVLSTWGPSWGETVIDDMIEEEDFFTSPVNLEVAVPLQDQDCWGERAGREGERSTFCRQYDGYGDLCNCVSPATLAYYPPQLENSVVDEIPLVIISSTRPQALYRCLVTVLCQEGAALSNVLVVIDGYNMEILALLHLLQVKYQVNVMEGQYFASSGSRISLHYRFALNTIFTAFPMASKAIVLEEDLLVAPDFFSYFNQTAWLLDADPSIFCISSWNDLGALHTAHNPHRLYRVETHAGYGWMLTRSLFDEIYHQWMAPNKKHDWDIWLRSLQIRAGRECVVPDVSRTFHYGVTGAHIKGALTHAHFSAHAVTGIPGIPLENVQRMTLEEYEEDIYKVLESDNLYFLNTTYHPCSNFFLPRNITAGPVVIFFSMESKGHYKTWKKLGACLGVWSLDLRSHHRGLFRLTFYHMDLYLIGYPYSDYSYLKPSSVHVVREPTEKEESIISFRTMENRVRFRRPELEKFSPYLMMESSTLEPIFLYG